MQRLEESEGVSHAVIWGRALEGQGAGERPCRGACLRCVKEHLGGACAEWARGGAAAGGLKGRGIRPGLVG